MHMYSAFIHFIDNLREVLVLRGDQESPAGQQLPGIERREQN